MKKILLSLFALLFISTLHAQSDLLSVKIGDQTWMVKNLDVDHYRNGDPIPEVKDPYAWPGLTTGAWCYYDNDPPNGKIYGKLYNWYAVSDPRGLAPAGWHIPSDSEWTTLEKSLGGISVAGGKLKEAGILHWATPNTGGDNSSGWAGLPGGMRDQIAYFTTVKQVGYWWTSSEHNIFAINHLLSSPSSRAGYAISDKRLGYSVRCVKD